eukprot:gene826-122_t
MEFVIARLLHEERKRCEVSSDPDISMEKALMAAKEKPSMHKPKFGNKRGKCFNCGLKGHFARNCHKPKKSKEKHEQQANFTETTDNKNALFWGSSNTNSDECFIWYIDSGASQHMSCNKNWMKNYNEFSVPEKVRLGDNRTVEALGKGTVWLRVMADGQYKPVEMSDVLYVPSLIKNLFSVRAVVDKDLTVIFKDDQCIILNKSGNVMGSGKKDGLVNRRPRRPRDGLEKKEASCVSGGSAGSDGFWAIFGVAREARRALWSAARAETAAVNCVIVLASGSV